jgi:DNA uptake protein ComE-like DNA-binding protein
VNVNTSPANEIIPVLGVSDEVGAAIVSRRAQHTFTSVADLAAIPGVDPAILQKRKDRILF